MLVNGFGKISIFYIILFIILSLKYNNSWLVNWNWGFPKEFSIRYPMNFTF